MGHGIFEKSSLRSKTIISLFKSHCKIWYWLQWIISCINELVIYISMSCKYTLFLMFLPSCHSSLVFCCHMLDPCVICKLSTVSEHANWSHQKSTLVWRLTHAITWNIYLYMTWTYFYILCKWYIWNRSSTKHWVIVLIYFNVSLMEKANPGVCSGMFVFLSVRLVE